MKSISTFTPIKNEVNFIGYHFKALYPYLSKFVWADGNSTDGTVELLRHLKANHDPDNKLTFFENMDCDVYGQSYEDLYNFLLDKCLDTEIVSYIHPDMIPENPELFNTLGEDDDCLRYNADIISFVGDTKHVWSAGRTNKWIIFNKNEMGLHYYGFYGDINEDLYYRDLTGDEHIIYLMYEDRLPYRIGESNIVFRHYCDAKPYERRFEKMCSVLKNHNTIYGVGTSDRESIEKEANTHPRVNCETGHWKDIKKERIEFVKIPFTGAELDVFTKYKEEFESFKR